MRRGGLGATHGVSNASLDAAMQKASAAKLNGSVVGVIKTYVLGLHI
jgi:hypothetical protein